MTVFHWWHAQQKTACSMSCFCYDRLQYYDHEDKYRGVNIVMIYHLPLASRRLWLWSCCADSIAVWNEQKYWWSNSSYIFPRSIFFFIYQTDHAVPFPFLPIERWQRIKKQEAAELLRRARDVLGQVPHYQCLCTSSELHSSKTDGYYQCLCTPSQFHSWRTWSSCSCQGLLFMQGTDNSNCTFWYVYIKLKATTLCVACYFGNLLSSLHSVHKWLFFFVDL